MEVQEGNPTADDNRISILNDKIAELTQTLTEIRRELRDLRHKWSVTRYKKWCPDRGLRNQPGWDVPRKTGKWVTKQFNARGRPICRRCRQSGHIKRNCQQPSGRVERVGPPCEGQSRDARQNTVVQNQVIVSGTPSDEDIQQVSAGIIPGQVVWFSVPRGYGFIKRTDTKKRVYVHYTAIQKASLEQCFRSLGSGEMVEFELANGKKGIKAINVTGPGGVQVQGNKHATCHKQYWCCSYCRDPPHNCQQDYQHNRSGEEQGEAKSAEERQQEPVIPEQTQSLERTDEQVVEEQSEKMQQSVPDAVRLQLPTQPLHEIKPRVEDTDSSMAYPNQVDLTDTDQEKHTEGVTCMSMAEGLATLRPNCPDSVMQNSESNVPAESPSVDKKSERYLPEWYYSGEYTTITSEEVNLMFQQALRRSGKRNKGASRIQNRY
ncbi:Y-box-binding protein 3-like [Pseudophryne corroboree]|uniref:Y-box-binding protein 3-like n=1 Tax=Pseudophryne corroboree TaxID=495146 RepID=UPI0030813C42